MENKAILLLPPQVFSKYTIDHIQKRIKRNYCFKPVAILLQVLLCIGCQILRWHVMRSYSLSVDHIFVNTLKHNISFLFRTGCDFVAPVLCYVAHARNWASSLLKWSKEVTNTPLDINNCSVRLKVKICDGDGNP